MSNKNGSAMNRQFSQSTGTVLMIRPVSFGFNAETASSNVFQHEDAHPKKETQKTALEEYLRYRSMLEEAGITIVEVEDTKVPPTPDSIFPNNWFLTLEDGTLALFPMSAPNRRMERKSNVIHAIEDAFKPKRILDLTHYEEEELFLEGTGSMVLDRVNRIIYASLSPRTSEKVLKEFASLCGYSLIMFHTADQNGMPIYHTNVLMAMGTGWVICCMDVIHDEKEREKLRASFASTGKQLISISEEQMNHYAGNCLELKKPDGEPFLICSQRAWESFTPDQKKILEAHASRISPDLTMIENVGGGSARCMLAELFVR